MVAGWVQVSVRARAAGRSVGDEVLSVLGVRAEDGLRLRIGGDAQPTLILLVVEALDDYAAGPDPHAAFAEAVEQALLAAAEWLRRLPDGAFEELRKRGVESDVIVRRDGVEASLPARFLLECGYAGLPVTFGGRG